MCYRSESPCIFFYVQLFYTFTVHIVPSVIEISFDFDFRVRDRSETSIDSISSRYIY